MDQIIISTYNISFGNKILDFGSFGKETYKYLDPDSADLQSVHTKYSKQEPLR